MAPPPAAASAAGDPAEAEPLEVHCVGCGEALQVERGLTEFICPDCATPQELPPELMPPRRRRALPLPRGVADARGARLPCGACGALLSVPVGPPRCTCPLCGAGLAVDTARLRQYLLASAAAADAVLVVPIASSSSDPPVPQARETEHVIPVAAAGIGGGVSAHQIEIDRGAQIDCPIRLIPEQAEPEHLDYSNRGGEVHEVNAATTRYKEQTNICSGGTKIVSAEKNQGEPLNQVTHRVQDLHSSCAFGTKHARQENSAVIRESGCIARISDSNSADTNSTSVRSIDPKTVNVEKRGTQTPKQIMQRSGKQAACDVTSTECAQTEYARAIHVQEKQQEPVNEVSHSE
ncbi:hypothetical protein ACP4OV_026296 [Aristida adscensionis]